MKKNVLVFPCGSEIALEVYRSVNKCNHFNLIGGSSCDDHGKFVYENYIDGIPYITEENFIPVIARIVKEQNIDVIFPAMDSVIEILKRNENRIGCKVVSSELNTTQICLSKTTTYKNLMDSILTPKLFTSIEDVKEYPVFVKPDVGYGSRGAKKCKNKLELLNHLEDNPTSVICEYLPGEEYTVDCFTNFNGELLCAYPRIRARIMNGISVNTKPVFDNGEFINYAKKINSKIKFNGAWFFQVKRNVKGELVLLEIAARFGGSSSLFRAKGINFALMSLYNIFGIPVSINENKYQVEMDRALDNKYKIDISYNEVFVDFDDCIYLNQKTVNEELIAFLYKCLNKDIKITLLSKHDDINLEPLSLILEKLRIKQLFDRIIHISVQDQKYKYIDNKKAIFIDDSFAERNEVFQKLGLNVFSIDMIEIL